MEFRGDLSSSTPSNHHVAPPVDLSGTFQPNKMKLATIQKRKSGRKKFQVTRHPVYKGVRRRNGKWVCELRHPNHNQSRIWLGTFSSPEMAARAHDAAAFALKRDPTTLNFPESAHLLPQARSTSIRDIQFAALEAAKEKGGSASSSSSSSSLKKSSRVNGDDDKLELKDGGEGRSKVVYLDEEELFNMPGLINGMAEGMILTPPALQRGFKWDDVEDVVDLTLWSD